MLIHESCFIYLSYIIFHSSVEKYLGGFHVFADSSSAAVIIFGHISLCPRTSFSGKNVEGDMLVCRVLDSLAQSAFSLLGPQELGPGALQGPDCPLALISSWHELVASCPWPCAEALAGWMVELAAGTGQLVPARGLGLCRG